MTDTLKTLNQVDLTTSVATIYTPSGALKGVVKRVVFYNYSSNDVLIEVYRQGTANSNRIFRGTVLASGGSIAFENDTMVLANGDSLKAKAASNTAIAVTVEGIEST